MLSFKSVISAVIIARNEAANIGRCVRSLLPVADEVLVLDTGSHDNTKEVAEAAGAQAYSVEWKGYAETKNEGYKRAAQPWILSLDADEVLSETLKRSILAVKEELKGAYRFNRLTFFGEKPVRHCGWYPDSKVRLFPKDQAKWEGEFVHEKLVVATGTEIIFLQGDLLHYSIRDREDHWARTREYAQLAAQKMHASGKRYSLLKHIFSPLSRFLKMYVFQLGFLDGKIGWYICYTSARSIGLRYRWLRKM